jgi:hypothetical protein
LAVDKTEKNTVMRRLIAGASSLALALGGFALAAAPAQAFTGASCDDGDAWSWSIANPARYQAGAHEAVVGLSEAIRTVTKAPTGCTVDAGDTWRVFNGYFRAAGTFNAEEAAAGRDTDRVSVAVPTSNAVAGDEIPVKLKVNDSSAGIPGKSGIPGKWGREGVECRLAGAAASHPVQVPRRHRLDELHQRALYMR